MGCTCSSEESDAPVAPIKQPEWVDVASSIVASNTSLSQIMKVTEKALRQLKQKAVHADAAVKAAAAADVDVNADVAENARYAHLTFERKDEYDGKGVKKRYMFVCTVIDTEEARKAGYSIPVEISFWPQKKDIVLTQETNAFLVEFLKKRGDGMDFHAFFRRVIGQIRLVIDGTSIRIPELPNPEFTGTLPKLHLTLDDLRAFQDYSRLQNIQ